MDSVRIWQPDDVACVDKEIYRTGKAAGIDGAIAITGTGSRKAFLLVETEDASEATHYTHSGSVAVIEFARQPGVLKDYHKPWYKLIPLTPPEPTPEEIAEKAKEEVIETTFESLIKRFPDGWHSLSIRKAIAAGYDAALAAAKK